MEDHDKIGGVPLLINYIEVVNEKFKCISNEEHTRKDLAAILSSVRRLERNIRHKQLDKGYIKRKTYLSKEEKLDAMRAKILKSGKK